jgi:hypothetical protein
VIPRLGSCFRSAQGSVDSLCPRSAEVCIWFLCSSKCQAREKFPARVSPASQALPFIFVPFPTVLSVLVFPLPATLCQVISFGSISISQAPSELPSLRLCSSWPQPRKHFSFAIACLLRSSSSPGNAWCSPFRSALVSQFAQRIKLLHLIF